MGENLIEGVILTSLNIISNSKGDILHGMKKSDSGYSGFGEAYFTKIRTNEIKGWNKHKKMTLNLCVPMGKVRFVLYDEREKSRTKGNFMQVEISVDDYRRLTIPPGIWLAFIGMDYGTNLILNVADLEHDPDEINRLDIEDSSIPYNWNVKNQ